MVVVGHGVVLAMIVVGLDVFLSEIVVWRGLDVLHVNICL